MGTKFKIMSIITILSFLFQYQIEVQCGDEQTKEMVAGTDEFLGKVEDKAGGNDGGGGGDKDKKDGGGGDDKNKDCGDDKNKDKKEGDDQNKDKKEGGGDDQNKDKKDGGGDDQNKDKGKEGGDDKKKDECVPEPIPPECEDPNYNDGYLELIPPNTGEECIPTGEMQPIDMGSAATGYMKFYDQFPEADPYHYRENHPGAGGGGGGGGGELSLAVMPPPPFLLGM